MSTSRSMCVSSVKVYSRKDNRRIGEELPRWAALFGVFPEKEEPAALPNGDRKYLRRVCQTSASGSPFLHNKFLIFPLAFLAKVMYYIKVS